MNSNCDDELSVESVEVVCCIQQACVNYVPFTCSTRSPFSVLRQFLSLSLIWLCLTRKTAFSLDTKALWRRVLEVYG